MTEVWMRYAACRGHTNEFYPEVDNYTLKPRKRTGRDPYATARGICAVCPVLASCRRYIEAHPQRWGMWAGMTPEERRTENLPAPPPPVDRPRLLSDEAVCDLRRRYASGEGPTGMARQYGVDTATALRAIHGDTYGHVDDIVPPVEARHLIRRERLALSQIEEAAQRWESGESIRSIAPDYDVTPQSLGRAIRRIRAADQARLTG